MQKDFGNNFLLTINNCIFQRKPLDKYIGVLIDRTLIKSLQNNISKQTVVSTPNAVYKMK